MAMLAITTSNSMSVKARFRLMSNRTVLQWNYIANGRLESSKALTPPLNSNGETEKTSNNGAHFRRDIGAKAMG